MVASSAFCVVNSTAVVARTSVDSEAGVVIAAVIWGPCCSGAPPLPSCQIGEPSLVHAPVTSTAPTRAATDATRQPRRRAVLPPVRCGTAPLPFMIPSRARGQPGDPSCATGGRRQLPNSCRQEQPASATPYAARPADRDERRREGAYR